MQLEGGVELVDVLTFILPDDVKVLITEAAFSSFALKVKNMGVPVLKTHETYVFMKVGFDFTSTLDDLRIAAFLAEAAGFTPRETVVNEELLDEQLVAQVKATVPPRIL